jgi:NAD(P)-dependent dehydrogenase (short-subunit alcohol dehydrogenase family)
MKESAKPEVVVVTGASAGLGRAIVRRFAREGAHIGLLARGRDGLEGARRDVEELGGKALVQPTDVADAEAVERAASAVEREFGPIDIWVNNAMVSVFSPVREMKPEEYKRVTEVTYLGYVYGTLAALRRMLPRDRGCVVQVGSALAYRGIPLQSAYCGSKHAIQGFMDSLRAELLHDRSNVRVTMVQMPAMNTPQFEWVKSRLPNKPLPVPPIFQPEVGAEAVYFVAHERRREMYVGLAFVLRLSYNLLTRTERQLPYDSSPTIRRPLRLIHSSVGRFRDRGLRPDGPRGLHRPPRPAARLAPAPRPDARARRGRPVNRGRHACVVARRLPHHRLVA